MGVIRLFLALCVANGHYATLILKPAGFNIDSWIALSALGVDAGHALFFFFIISGFLISLILDKKYPAGYSGTYAFYKSRAIRIYSFYWPVYLFSIALIDTPAFLSEHRIGDMFTGFFLIGSDWKIALGDYPNHSFAQFPHDLNPAWSLGAEMGFYLLAPLLLRSRAAILCMMAMSMVTRFALYQTFGFDTTWTYTFFPSDIFFFLIGHFSYRLYANYPSYPCRIRGSQQRSWALIIMAAGFMVAGIGKSFDSPYFYAAVLFFCLALPSIFYHTKDNATLNFLGNLSYPVYIIHSMCLQYFNTQSVSIARMLVSSEPLVAPIASVIMIVIILSISVIAHFLVERPCAYAMRLTMQRIENYSRARGRWPNWRSSSIFTPIS